MAAFDEGRARGRKREPEMVPTGARLSLLYSGVLLLALVASPLGVGTAGAVEPAPGPENVPKLGEDFGDGVATKPGPNRSPEITGVTVNPPRAVVGVDVQEMPVSGARVTVKVTVTATDPDGDVLTYTYSDNLGNPDETVDHSSVGFTVKKPLVIELTVGEA